MRVHRQGVDGGRFWLVAGSDSAKIIECALARLFLRKRSPSMTISILGIDIGENSCSVAGVDDSGAVTIRRTTRRQTLIGFVSKSPTCWRRRAAPGLAPLVPRARRFRLMSWSMSDHEVRRTQKRSATGSQVEKALPSASPETWSG